ncbi:MAG TPA: FecR domain-containing protein [Allosphingosinicella sp.]|nr:FecR domain-containing protein [Allosphingosinicella sp.]
MWPFLSSNERLRREAAAWLAKLQGPDAQGSRAEFERWRRSSPDRAAAYERIRSRYEAAGLLTQSDLARGRTLASERPRSRTLTYAFAAAAGCAVVLALFLLAPRNVPIGHGVALQRMQIAAAPGNGRKVVLVDGSVVTLAPGSSVTVDLAADERRLHLLSGEGRFSVAHEKRPFVVLAGRTRVIAHGTEFIVRLGPERTIVSLIAGAIEVSYPQRPSATSARRVSHLKPGDRLVVDNPTNSPSPRVPPQAGAGAAMLQFDATPVGEAVAEANQGKGPKIRIEDASIAALRVTGAFRAGDTRGLADSLAAAFGLQAARAPDGSILLRRPAATLHNR